MPPYPIEWLDEPRADVRRLHRPTAMRIRSIRGIEYSRNQRC
jgi:hypothetical protein